LILGIGNIAVRNVTELSMVMEKINAGDIVNMTIMRIAESYFGPVRRRYVVG
jgi:hypothetical protein